MRILLQPPTGAEKTRVLRKLADNFAGQDDPAAGIAYEGADTYFVDAANLANGTPYYYRDFTYDGAAWADSGFTAVATPAASYAPIGPDPLSFIRDRLELGLKAEVAAGRLRHDLGYIPCLTAPPQYEGTKFPIVTVHLMSQDPMVRGIGEMVGDDSFDLDAGVWDLSEGWLARTQIEIWGWVVENPDVRLALRQAINRVLIGNLPVFHDVGIDLVSFSFADREDLDSYNARVFQTVCQFSCIAPSAIGATEDAVSGVTVNATAAWPLEEQ